MKQVFLTAEWRYLAMLNFEVDRSVLEPLTPQGTELDTTAGRHFISLVGFLFLDTHVLNVPAFFHRDFEEVNLRFYVRYQAADGWRRGVVFIKELVHRRLVALIARTVYHEHFVTLPMRHHVRLPTPTTRSPSSPMRSGRLLSSRLIWPAGRISCRH